MPGGPVYTAKDIDRLHYGPKPKASRHAWAYYPDGVKTRSDLVVMPCGARIFAFIHSPCAHMPQKSWCVSTAQNFHTAWVISSNTQREQISSGLVPHSGHSPKRLAGQPQANAQPCRVLTHYRSHVLPTSSPMNGQRRPTIQPMVLAPPPSRM